MTRANIHERMKPDDLRILAFLTNKNTDFKEELERVDASLYILPSTFHKLHNFYFCDMSHKQNNYLTHETMKQ